MLNKGKNVGEGESTKNGRGHGSLYLYAIVYRMLLFVVWAQLFHYLEFSVAIRQKLLGNVRALIRAELVGRWRECEEYFQIFFVSQFVYRLLPIPYTIV